MQRHILVGDRCVMVAERLQDFFSRRGFRVDTALDGLECVGKLRQKCPDMLILDANLQWGGADGVLAWMRNDSACARVPVVLLSDRFSNPLNAVASFASQLQRPFEVHKLYQAVHCALGSATDSVPPESQRNSHRACHADRPAKVATSGFQHSQNDYGQFADSTADSGLVRQS